MKFKSLALLLLMGTSAFAQPGNGAGNGGDLSEAQLKIYLNRVAEFLETEVGKAKFPEISGTEIVSIAKSVNPTIVKEELKDRFGQVRTCINEPKSKTLKCNQALMNSAYNAGPALYVVLFHEMLNFVNLEISEDGNVPSVYPISSRIAQFAQLKVQYDWQLSENGDLHQSFDMRKQGSYTCSLVDRRRYFSKTGRKMAPFIVIQEGHVWIANYGEPDHWGWYYQASTPKQMKNWERTKARKEAMGTHPRLEILYSGEMNVETAENSFVVSAFSKEQNKFRYPEFGMKLYSPKALDQMISEVADRKVSSFLVTVKLGTVVGQDYAWFASPGYVIDGTSEAFFCELGIRGRISNGDHRFMLLEDASKQNGHVPFVSE